MSAVVKLIYELEAGSTDLSGCLSTSPELTREEQFQLVLADQKVRVRRGEACDYHRYVKILPWLADEESLQQELVLNEFTLRLGSAPAEVLLSRFLEESSNLPLISPKQLRNKVEQWNQQPLSHAEIDILCDRFEDAVIARQSPLIEDYLSLVPSVSHSDVLVELLCMETYHLCRRGISPDWEGYQTRFPIYLESIRQIRAQNQGGIKSKDRSSNVHLVSARQYGSSDLSGTFISQHTVGDLRNGRYRLERKLGQGTYGAVYLAQDKDLKRQVAVKVPSREALKNLVDVESYLREAQNVAALDHPHIVPVYDVGRTIDSSIYVVSKFIDGCSLSDWIKKNALDFSSIAKLLEPIAQALHHAHQRRLIHRDIKPANILIEESTRTPYVADFGLAIREEDYLQDGRIAGSPAYMSPEQVRGEGHRLDGRSDLFSLGVVMYSMLTGRLPFTGQTREEIAHEITTLQPHPPRSIKQDIPAELERICLKLLSKRASDRYVNGQTLAEDLKVWLGRQSTKVEEKSVQRITPRGLRSFTAEDASYFLDLLPGARNREGLPLSIAFWKTKIEQRDPDQTFTVGLLYGPSGCGKSSIVKAGLIPCLSPEVVAIYIEATPDETESRLLRQLRKRNPDLPNELDLAESFERLRRTEGPKVAIIIDQFEQWLYSHRVELDGELVRALRQCDGGRLQAILMIRDDFYLAAARLMNHIDVPILTDQNFKLVDLFDLDHAKRVLVRFGEAYERLPMNATSRTPEQNAFVAQVVEGLSEGGKVVSVRLSLLTDMLKGRDWTQLTLDTIGGLEGIGIHFLEETFASNRADARHRVHQVAVRGVLRALLPDSGTDIKGSMRSEEELLAASGYTNRRPDFQDLLRILDGELRLLTPTDPEGHDSQSGSDVPPRRYYQLTHDYLVPSLREWLTRKQRETKKGLAELKLAERAAAWHLNPESKQLPTYMEWFQIRRLTEPAKWKPNEKSVMRQATRHYVKRMTLFTAAVVLLACCGWFAWGEASRRQEAIRIEGLVNALTNAEPAQIPEIVKQLDANPKVAASYLEPLLTNEAATPAEQRSRLHARLAVVSLDASLVGPLVEELLTGKVSYVLSIRELLRPLSAKLTDALQSLLHDEKTDPQRRFRAALALADYVSTSDESIWTESNRQFIAQQLVESNAEFQPILREAVRPIQGKLLVDLERIFGDVAASDAARLSAANALADYAAEDRSQLTRLLTVATQEQHKILYPLVSAFPSQETISQLSEVAATLPPEDLGSVPRIAYGQRRANAAVTLLKLGEKDKVLPVFDWTDDPEAMTQFIFRCKPRGISVDTLLDLLDNTSNRPEYASHGFLPRRLTSTARYAILLAIGEYAPGQILPARREALVKHLADWYANDPSSGVHGASGWLLRYLGEKEIADRVDQTPVPYSPEREWFTVAITVKPTPTSEPKTDEKEEQTEDSVSDTEKPDTETQEPEASPDPVPQKTFYYTFIVQPHGEYTIGSIKYEVDQIRANEVRHKVILTRPFALLDREITFEELIAFSPQYLEFMHKFDAHPTDAGFGADWYDAVAFCRWLGKELGLPETEQCYADPRTLDKEKYPRDPQVTWAPRNWPLALDKYGFRLPTESEWEVVARSGSRTAYGFGSEVALLDRFGWFFTEDSGKHVHPGREQRPSVRGLFDMHGNLFEWTHDWLGDIGESAQTDPLGAKWGSARVRRGGSWNSTAANCRAAYRVAGNPTNRTLDYGFRLALSLPSQVPAESESSTGAKPAGEGTERASAEPRP